MADEVGISGDGLLKLVTDGNARADQALARIETKLDNKVDKGDLLRIEARLDEHGRKIGQLEDRQREEEAAQQAIAQRRAVWVDWRKWSVGVAVILVASQPWNWHL